ncbi:MAG: RDD family protein [Pseudomonadota bacterium]
MSQIALPNTNAGLFRRIAAGFYDSLLLIAVYFLLGAIAVALNSGEALSDLAAVSLGLAVFPFVAFVFYSWFWLRDGQTLGMQAWRLKITTQNGDLTLKQCLIRFVLSIIGILCCGLGVIWILFDGQNRAWHDIASKTRIVRLQTH